MASAAGSMNSAMKASGRAATSSECGIRLVALDDVGLDAVRGLARRDAGAGQHDDVDAGQAAQQVGRLADPVLTLILDLDPGLAAVTSRHDRLRCQADRKVAAPARDRGETCPGTWPAWIRAAGRPDPVAWPARNMAPGAGLMGND